MLSISTPPDRASIESHLFSARAKIEVEGIIYDSRDCFFFLFTERQLQIKAHFTAYQVVETFQRVFLRSVVT